VLVADRTVLWLFAAELALRLLSFRPPDLDLFDRGVVWRAKTHLFGRLRHLLTPLLMIDLLAVLALIPAMRGLRALRLLRLIRFTRLFRYSSPFTGIIRAFQENALLYIFTFVFLTVVVVLGGVSIFLAEARYQGADIKSIPEGIWWALVTLTTVGYGDFTPTTPLGRVVAGTVMVLGMFTLALFAGIVGSTLLRVLVGLRQDQFRMSSYSGHIVICGYDRAAPLLLEAVKAEFPTGERELVVFGPGDRPGDLPPDFIWVGGDPSKESELEKVRLSHAHAAIIVGSRKTAPPQADANTIMVVFTMRSYLDKQPVTERRKRPLYVIAEILDPENVGHARTAGADEVIETTRLGFSLIAHAAVMPGSGTIMSTVASAGAHSLYIASNPVNEPISYAELSRKLRSESGAVLIGVRDPETAQAVIGPEDEMLVEPDKQVVYLARSAVIPESETVP
jgi:voltage-gated potassium channel